MKILNLVLALLLMAGGARAQDSAPLKVVTSNSVLADFVAQAGAVHVQVTPLVPPGMDMHSYEPSPAEVRTLQQADLVVVNGLGLEGWMEKVIANSGYTGRVVLASEGVEALLIEAGEQEAHDHDHDHDHAGHEHHHHEPGEADPHAWLDPSQAAVYMRNIQTALAEARPDAAKDFEAWGELYVAHLRVLDSWIKRQVSALPRERRVLVTDHDAFRYFARAYGFETLSLSGVSRLDEPSAQQFAALIEHLREHGVSAVFSESAANEKMLGRLASEAGVAMGGQLAVEGLAAGTARPTYIEMMKVNVRIIVSGLAAEPAQ